MTQVKYFPSQSQSLTQISKFFAEASLNSYEKEDKILEKVGRKLKFKNISKLIANLVINSGSKK